MVKNNGKKIRTTFRPVFVIIKFNVWNKKYIYVERENANDIKSVRYVKNMQNILKTMVRSMLAILVSFAHNN